QLKLALSNVRKASGAIQKGRGSQIDELTSIETTLQNLLDRGPHYEWRDLTELNLPWSAFAAILAETSEAEYGLLAYIVKAGEAIEAILRIKDEMELRSKYDTAPSLTPIRIDLF
ncbi:unnamed protein product, partial [marine sediment metagenome]